MNKDIRSTALYRDAERVWDALWCPGAGQISDGAEVHASPDGRYAIFAGAQLEALAGTPLTRICRVDLRTGDLRLLTSGPNSDRLPKYSPDGRWIAFLSDRNRTGDFQLYLLDPVSGATQAAARVEGWGEYLQWSPDGSRILLGVAGYGADVAGTQGAVTSSATSCDQPAWLPIVDCEDESFQWRRVWVYELGTDRARQVSGSDLNVWEACWCGNDCLAVIASNAPAEGHWYRSRLHLVQVVSGDSREIYTPKDQLGWLAASPSGKYLAVAEAVCSDRWLVAGDLRLIVTSSGDVQRVDTLGVNVTTLEWRSDRMLLLAGLRGSESVIGLYDVSAARFSEVWKSRELSSAGPSISIAGLGEAGDCVLQAEGFGRAPEIGIIRRGVYRTIRSLKSASAAAYSSTAVAEEISWRARDGLEIDGWLLRPEARQPYPLVMCLHGGPVSNWRPVWPGRPRTVPWLMLLEHGYSVFLPNPRGSSGRGQAFARQVLGDVGGADAEDCLTGLDQLIERGLADPRRLGVTGVSYGGFLSATLIARDSRFAAAVIVSPITNFVTEELISNIPQFVKHFVADSYLNPDGRYYSRSPVLYAHRVKTPTLNICGAVDRCTPPQEAIQFHRALLEHGVKSVLVVYPDEGHGVRKLPAAIDYAGRLTSWFKEHIPVVGGGGGYGR